MIALALALAAASSSPAEEALQRQLIPCRQAALATLEGDPNFLDRLLAKARRQERARVKARCAIYLLGAIDGAMIERVKAGQ